MRASTVRVAFAPSQGYVCLSCRLQSAGVRTGRSRRYQHTNPPGNKEANDKDFQPPSEVLGDGKGAKSSSSSTISDIIKAFIVNDTAKVEGKTGDGDGDKVGPLAALWQEVSTRGPHEWASRLTYVKDLPTKPEPANDGAQATQKALQQKFAAARRRQKVQMQADLPPKGPVVADAEQGTPILNPISKPTKPLSQKVLRQQRVLNRAAKRQKGKAERKERHKAKEAAKRAQQVLDRKEGKKLSASALLEPLPGLPENNLQDALAHSGSEVANEDMPVDDHSVLGSLSEDGGLARKVMSTVPERLLKDLIPSTQNERRTRKIMTDISDPVPQDGPTEGSSTSKPTASARGVTARKSLPELTSVPALQTKEKRGEKRLSETERKAELARKLGMKIHKHAVEHNPHFAAKEAKAAALSTSRKLVDKKKDVLSRSKETGIQVSDVAGFDTLQGALGRKAAKIKTAIEKADATQLEILPLEVKQPPVPSLSYGLERVLFNPGVYQLQDPRSRVFNFDPYLQKIMPVAEFDFNALKEYITSSRDEALNNIAKTYGKRYMGSTSSMTGALSHFHFLLSQWRPINTSMMSKQFPAHLTSFTELQRTPQAIFLKWKDGTYAIDADKQFASANVLSMLGKSMEKLLTLSTDDYERYRKSSNGKVTDEESLAPESYHYSTMGDFLMRSQLDAHDPRLPGTGMFDLKTRAVVSIRMDVSNYEHGLGYQIKSRQGEWESYEREYYDMIRAAFLKYSMQVRMGRMDGIFVAFHNIERIFGFQYISLPEMDSTIHGQWDTSIGDQEFKLSLDLLNKILDKATKKYPETSLRIHFETRDAATPFMYIFAEPVTDEQVAEIQSQNDTKIREFERNILGLRRGEDSEIQDDDGKWDNIQASVQEAMDKDALSVDDPGRDQDLQDEEVEGERLYHPQSVLEEGPLYAHRNRVVPEDTNPVTAPSGDDEVEEEEKDDAETEEVTEGVDQDQLEAKEEDEAMNEENEADGEAKEDRALDNNEEPDDFKEAPEEEGDILKDPADKNQASDESALERDESFAEAEHGAGSLIDEGKDSQRSEEPLESGITEETRSPPAATKKGVKEAEKAAYTPPVPGDDRSETDFQTEADRSFLDAIHKETAHLENTTPESSEILAMTLTLRNKVNGQFVLRPEKLTADDVWSIEYSLVEVPNQKRARALYEACQTRRKKKLDAPMIPEDAEVINSYLVNLRKMSMRGKQWREEMDERDKKRPVQVLGREMVTSAGETARTNQDSEA